MPLQAASAQLEQAVRAGQAEPPLQAVCDELDRVLTATTAQLSRCSDVAP